MNNVTDLRNALDVGRFGGKAANLSRLLGMGLNVPPGFVIRAADLPLQPQFVQNILKAFDSLDAPYVAVRSSAASEDGSTAAWAGQLDTFLNVTRRDLIEHIEKCIRSASSDRAKAYARHQHITSGGVAVVVQAMIASEISGVAFSAHPVTRSRDQFVIEAGLGLGEAIVSGEITPDTYVLNAADGSTFEQYISTQTKRLIRNSSGTGWEILDPPMVTAKLTATQLSELAEVLHKITDEYDRPMDIEWAYAGGALYILQARPITAL